MSFFEYDPPKGPLKIIHSDHEIVVVDKPAGLLSVPGKGDHLADCLIDRVVAEFPTALLVHRLDCDTSGVMIFALSPLAQKHLGKQFETRKTRKVYEARVTGVMDKDDGSIDAPLIVDWPNRPKQVVCHETGKPSHTDYKVLSRGGNETKVRLFPKTGRSHQLRVHMLHLGHPILGDTFYGVHDGAGYDRMMLHSTSLKVRHPDGGEEIQFKSRAPF